MKDLEISDLFKNWIFLLLTSPTALLFAHEQVAMHLFCNNRILDGSVTLKTKSLSNVLECSRACMKQFNCKSANFARNGSESTCRMLFENFVNGGCKDLSSNTSNDFIRMYDPCYYGFRYDGNTCNCSEGFTGEFCRIPPSATQVELESGRFKTRVFIDKQFVSLGRGLTVLVFSGINGSFESRATFDTYGDTSTSIPARDYLKIIDNGALVVLITSDDATARLQTELRNYIKDTYSSIHFETIGYRDVFVLVAYQGGNKLYERISKKQPGKDWPDSLKAGFKLFEENNSAKVHVMYG